jgi:chromate transporter
MSAPAAAPPSDAEPPDHAPRPASIGELFRVFNGLALRGFGGVLPFAQRTLVEERRWLTPQAFAEALSLAQVLPGPNICNLALMIGDRFFGLRGAFAALAGMMAAPMALVLALAALHGGFGREPLVARMLEGMAAASAGLILAMALKLASSLRGRGVAGWIFAALAFVAVGPLRWPLLPVLVAGAGASVLVAWRRLPPP